MSERHGIAAEEPAPIETVPREAWSRPCDRAAGNDSGVVCVAGMRAFALDPDTGNVRWSVPSARYYEPRLVGDKALLGPPSRLRAYDLRTGRSTPARALEAMDRVARTAFRIEQELRPLPYRDEEEITVTMTDMTSGEKEIVDSGYAIHPYCLAVTRDVAYVGEPDSDYNTSREGVLVWATKFGKGRLWDLEIATPPRSTAGFPLMATREVRRLIPLSHKLLVVANAAVHCLVGR